MKSTIHALGMLLLGAVCAVTGNVATAQDVVTYFHADAIGSPIAATDANGNLLWREDYAPYGERLRQENSPRTNRMWFTGHHHEDDTGLTYAGARHYDPMIGRFLSVDPALLDPANPFTVNRYAYGNDNPYRYVDPDGRDPEVIFGIVMGIVHKKEDALLIQQAELAANNFAAADAIDIGMALAEGKRALERGESVNGGSLKGALTAATAAVGTAIVKKKSRKKTDQLHGGVEDATVILGNAEKWLGKGYKEIAPGVFRSADGRRQFRMTDDDLTDRKVGPHVHFESIDADGRTIVENSHVYLE